MANMANPEANKRGTAKRQAHSDYSDLQDTICLHAATVFGLGRVMIKKAPGTWGSMVGLLLGMGLSWLSEGWSAYLILAVTFLPAVKACDQTERLAGETDPPAIILDEVWGMAAVILLQPWVLGTIPLTVTAFGLFRAFDILKPAPLKWLAGLKGGLGIMADDGAAALYTVLVLAVITFV